MMIDGVAVVVVVEAGVKVTRNEGIDTAVSVKKTKRSVTGKGMTIKGITNGLDVIASIITDERIATREGTGNDTARDPYTKR